MNTSFFRVPKPREPAKRVAARLMVLKPSPSGDSCAAMVTPKDGGEPVVCGRTQAHAWYAGPTCKSCYEKACTKKRGRSTASCEEEENESAGDTLLEIIDVEQIRCARTAPPQPHARLHVVHSLASTAAESACVC